jgi:DNA-binding NarL/FixJ family response regulator
MVVEAVRQTRISAVRSVQPPRPVHPVNRSTPVNLVTRIAVAALDPLSRAGLVALLQGQSGLKVVNDEQGDSDVLVLAASRLDSRVVSILRRSASVTQRPVILVVDEITETELILAVECRVLAVLPRAAATGERLVRTVRSVVHGGGVLPTALVGDLLNYLSALQKDVLQEAGLGAAGLTPREVEVIRLMAEGLETAEIGSRLGYSGRTVKGIIHQVAHKHQLRNRSHIIAHAMRAGVI